MYNTVKLEKGLYNLSGKSFTQALSELDPDSAYSGTELYGLDAFERQLKRFDIKIKHEQYAKHTLREKMQFNATFHAKCDIIYL